MVLLTKCPVFGSPLYYCKLALNNIYQQKFRNNVKELNKFFKLFVARAKFEYFYRRGDSLGTKLMRILRNYTRTA